MESDRGGSVESGRGGSVDSDRDRGASFAESFAVDGFKSNTGRGMFEALALSS